MPRKTPFGDDEKFLRLALAEAAQGLGQTHPNPAVGAVLVKSGRVLATGWHRKAGAPHAEIEALNALPSHRLARGATLYVTLEPCSTHGRTPPCTAAILAAGVRRVVYGATDPNPAHAGRAARILTEAGIAVTSGVLERECSNLNRAWNKWIATGVPFVTGKVGMSLDGRISSHPSARWITGEPARRDAMRVRAECGAILVGAGTLRADNPRLTLRGVRGRQPLRVVWTRSGRLPRRAFLFTDRFKNRTVISRADSLGELLRDLGTRGVSHVLIEGGSTVLGEAFDGGFVDRLVFYIAPKLLGGPSPAIGGTGAGSLAATRALEDVTVRKVGDDLRIEGFVTPASSEGSWLHRSTRQHTAGRTGIRISNP